MKFLGKEGNWYKVRVGGREGYMSRDYLEEVPYEAGMENEVETEPQTEAPTPIYKTLKGAWLLKSRDQQRVPDPGNLHGRNHRTVSGGCGRLVQSIRGRYDRLHGSKVLLKNETLRQSCRGVFRNYSEPHLDSATL